VTDETQPLVLVDPPDRGVLTLRFNRPERRNAWSHEMEAAYFAALAAAADDPAVRAVVITGAGDTFCPGADIMKLSAAADGKPSPHDPPRPSYPQVVFPKPLVAAVAGLCAGGGLVQALFCDVRFVAHDAVISTAWARRGLAAEYGMSWLLPRIVGFANALDLLLTARKITGDEAHRLGLANFVSDADRVLDDAQSYARQMAELCSPVSMATIRFQVWADASRNFAESWAEFQTAGPRVLGMPDAKEGAASFRERRPPRFDPLPPGFRPDVRR
jgi:enoyl-CoA hydratase/carnithine racemase